MVLFHLNFVLKIFLLLMLVQLVKLCQCKTSNNLQRKRFLQLYQLARRTFVLGLPEWSRIIIYLFIRFIAWKSVKIKGKPEQEESKEMEKNKNYIKDKGQTQAQSWWFITWYPFLSPGEIQNNTNKSERIGEGERLFLILDKTNLDISVI